MPRAPMKAFENLKEDDKRIGYNRPRPSRKALTE